MSFFFSRRPKSAECAAEIVEAGRGRVVVRLSGDWTKETASPSPEELLPHLRREAESGPYDLVADASGVVRYDSVLPAYLLAARELALENCGRFSTLSPPAGAEKLFKLALARPVAADAVRTPEDFTLLHLAGTWGLNAAQSWNKAFDFVGRTVLALGAMCLGRARFRKSDLAWFIQSCGVDALPIVTLISFLTGLIMAYVGAVMLKQFGATIYVANMVGLAMTREMGVLMTGIVLCGRTGTAFAAQLGSMNASEEIPALRVLGIDPVQYLVLPRMIALTLMMPLLTLYANFVGIMGGLAVVSAMDVTPQQYFNQLVRAVSMASFCSGLIKSVFFGALVAWAGCFRGMTAGRSSLDVGNAATGAAVLGITLIIVGDAIFAVIFNIIGFF